MLTPYQITAAGEEFTQLSSRSLDEATRLAKLTWPDAVLVIPESTIEIWAQSIANTIGLENRRAKLAAVDESVQEIVKNRVIELYNNK